MFGLKSIYDNSVINFAVLTEAEKKTLQCCSFSSPVFVLLSNQIDTENMYSGDLNTGHSNNRTIPITDFTIAPVW